MASYEVAVTIQSARGLHNINSPNGDLRPYAVMWVDAADMRSTMAVVDGGTNPVWNQTLIIPLPRDLHPVSAVLSIHIVHDDDGDGVNSPVGVVRIHLREVVDVVGIGGEIACTVDLYLPSEPDRTQGSLEVKVRIFDIRPPSYGQPFAVPFAPPPNHGHNHPHYYVPPPAPVYYPAPSPAGYGYGQQTSTVNSFGAALVRGAIEGLVRTGMDTLMQTYDVGATFDGNN